MPTTSTQHFKKPSAYKNVNTSAMTKDFKATTSTACSSSSSGVYEYCIIS